MKAKIMLIGGGGREDAIARKIVENGYIYIANPGSNNVSVINASTNTIVKTISVGY